jgi:hypothetical protein
MADVTTTADGNTVAPTALQAAAPAAEAPSISQSVLDLAGSVLSNNTGRGAAMGGLLGYLLNQYATPGGVNLGVDMSKASGITPRTTTLPRSRYVSYSDYGVENQAPAMSPQMARDFGISGGLTSRMPVSSYSAVPARQNLAPVSFTSAGAGTGKLQNPTVTPRANNMISPLTGALMGSAIGYLMPSSSGTTSGTGGTGGGAAGSRPSGGFNNALSNLLGALGNKSGSPNLPTNPNAPNYDASGWKTDSSGDLVYVNDQGKVINPDTGLATGDFNPYGGQDFGTDINKYDPPVDHTVDPFVPDTSLIYDQNGNYLGDDGYMTDYTSGSNNNSFVEPDISYGFTNDDTSSYYRDGGMATPMMAEGGEVPSYYTYGTAIDPQQIMQNMAKGGQPQSGLHVPTVEGRHDYRSGSRVTGEGDGQSDDIPAMLADGEYVFDADTVAQLGNGSTKAGSDLLDRFREEIRSHKRSAPVNKIPPPAKSPLAYLKAARSKK